MSTEESPPVSQKTESDRLDPWIKDGNVVLAVEDKYFRVHRSILSSYSDVFRDMFDCPQPSEGSSEEMIEQCPVIRLHHDMVTDVQMVLRAMYDRSYPVPYYEKVPFPVVAAFLRLGEKYSIRHFLDEAEARLSCPYENTLGVAAKMSSARSGTLQLFPGIANSDPHNFQVMNLLQEMDLKASLPLAMYQCVVACPLPAVLDGYTFNSTFYTLSPANLRSFVLMKHAIENLRIRLAQSVRVSSNCVIQSSCVCHIRRLWSDEVTIAQPLGPWRHEWDKLFCDACRSDLNMWRNSTIQKAWMQLPTAFGFESWSECNSSKLTLDLFGEYHRKVTKTTDSRDLTDKSSFANELGLR